MSDAYQHFLTLDTSPYQEGEYLILVEDEVVRHGKDVKPLLDEVRKEYPQKTPYIAKVPAAGVMVLAVIHDRV